MLEVFKSNRHEKTWGNEEWLCNNSKYCGKILNVLPHKYCSFHYHKLKTEDFYVLKGSVVLQYQKISNKTGKLLDDRENVLLEEGHSIHIEPYTVHRFIGCSNRNSIIETSTQHFEEDSYRLEPSWSDK